MPSELEELVQFITHGNTQIRQTAVEALVPYSIAQPNIFKSGQLLPVKNLTLLIRDYKPIAKNALIILTNLSTDCQILELLVSNDELIGILLRQIANPSEANINEISMLLANLGKHNGFKTKILNEKPTSNEIPLGGRPIDHLLDLFVKDNGTKNKSSDFDYLSYLFADIATQPGGRRHLLTLQDYDQVIPLSKLIIFTSHESRVRRQGVASTIKNVCFETTRHCFMLSDDENGLGLLPYLLLPLMGPEEYDEHDSEGMLEECQLLPVDKEREVDSEILKIHLESLILLTTTRRCRELLRKVKVYPTIRELHLVAVDNEVQDACDRLVQILMREEEEDKDYGTENLLRENLNITTIKQ